MVQKHERRSYKNEFFLLTKTKKSWLNIVAGMTKKKENTVVEESFCCKFVKPIVHQKPLGLTILSNTIVLQMVIELYISSR